MGVYLMGAISGLWSLISPWWRKESTTWEKTDCYFFAQDREISPSLWKSFVVRRTPESITAKMVLAGEREVTALIYGPGYYAYDPKSKVIYQLSLLGHTEPVVNGPPDWELHFFCYGFVTVDADSSTVEQTVAGLWAQQQESRKTVE